MKSWSSLLWDLFFTYWHQSSMKHSWRLSIIETWGSIQIESVNSQNKIKLEFVMIIIIFRICSDHLMKIPFDGLTLCIDYSYSNVGLCYGKLEAGILTFIIPTVLLGHLVTPIKFWCRYLAFFLSCQSLVWCSMKVLLKVAKWNSVIIFFFCTHEGLTTLFVKSCLKRPICAECLVRTFGPHLCTYICTITGLTFLLCFCQLEWQEKNIMIRVSGLQMLFNAMVWHHYYNMGLVNKCPESTS